MSRLLERRRSGRYAREESEPLLGSAICLSGENGRDTMVAEARRAEKPERKNADRQTGIVPKLVVRTKYYDDIPCGIRDLK